MYLRRLRLRLLHREQVDHLAHASYFFNAKVAGNELSVYRRVKCYKGGSKERGVL